MSIADQIARMRARWPRFALRNVDHKGRAARWIGIVQPQLSSYTLDVQYSIGAFPKVRVAAPSLTRLPGGATATRLSTRRRSDVVHF
jgi:hypothetical protein